MNLLAFDVDLSSYSGDEFEEKYKLLDNLAWTISEYALCRKIFMVTWNHAEPINEILDIPANLVRRNYGNS